MLASASPDNTIGTERKTSTMRIRLCSTNPRKNPARRPTTVPSSTEVTLATIAMIRVARSPVALRANMSRPSESVPKKCPGLKGPSGAPRSVRPSLYIT